MMLGMSQFHSQELQSMKHDSFLLFYVVVSSRRDPFQTGCVVQHSTKFNTNYFRASAYFQKAQVEVI